MLSEREADGDAIREVSISHNPTVSHSTNHRFDGGSIEAGSIPGKFVPRGNVYDTSCDPPQPCFNCQGNHWRKDCPEVASARTMTTTVSTPSPTRFVK
ncbi:hypothetical protein P43SY_010410 [Pythium insidiosum]|uniref:CCHC-type domain-containing protein n=1 Tax=Pythium insidiosum TaxID=114742 RepID=A0AAD5Q3Z2_PYTIN|nr:hypothetical protein P43SY_010410 [Pythium insidiosum]